MKVVQRKIELSSGIIATAHFGIVVNHSTSDYT